MLTINNTLDGYLKDVEIKGNTVQDPDNLADIKSVGDKVEGQELYKIPILINNGLDNSDSKYKEQVVTIFSPKPLKSYNGVKDRILCKNNIWVHEENVIYDTNGNGTILDCPIDTQLPNEQKVELKTFSNTTNISLLTNVNGIIKANVPRFLGDIVISNSEKINNISNEIKKIKNTFKNFMDYSKYKQGNDWTNAFKKMAEDIGIRYNSIYIPCGKYEITERIIFESKKDIVILSDFAEIKNTVQNNNNATGGTFYFRNCENVHIEGIKHKGIDNTYPLQNIDYGHHGMMLHGCTNVSILRNHFYDFADNALLLGQDSNNDIEKNKHGKNIWVKDCYFKNIWQTSTTTMGANNVYYVNNIFEKLAGSCKFAQRYDLGGNLFILGNRINGVKKSETTSTSYSHGIELNNYRNVIIKDNIIDSVGGQGVFISNNTRSEDANRYVLTGEITIENNKISNFDTGGIYLYNPTVTINSTSIKEKMSNIYIRNNTFNNEVKSSSSTIQCSGNQLTDIYIENNFSNNPNVAFFNYACEPILNTDSTYKYTDSRIYIRNNTALQSSNGVNILKYIKGLVVENNFIEATTYCISTSVYNEDYIIKNNTLSMIGTNGNCINGQGELNRAIIEGNIFNTNNLGSNLTLTGTNWIKFINNTFINPNAFGIRLANQAGVLYHLGNVFTNDIKKITKTGTTEIVNIATFEL